MAKDGPVMTDAEKAEAQAAYIASQVSTLQSSLATLTTAVNLTANNTLITKMNTVNADAGELYQRMNGGCQVAADIFSSDFHTMSGGDGCGTKKAPSIP